jgi:EpsI family protein
MPNLLHFLPAAVLGGGVALLFGSHEQARLEPRRSLELVLDTVPGMRYARQEVDTNSQRVAGMDHYVARVYSRDTVPVFTLYVGYYRYQSQGHTIHSPRNCLPGAGWESVESATLRIPGVQAAGSGEMNKFVLANRGAYAAVYYWYQGRGRIEANEYTVKANLLKDAALYGRTEESLVRLIVPLETSRDRSPTHVKREIVRADSIALSLAPRLANDVAAVMPAAPGS